MTSENSDLDPRIQIELENLNSATDAINKLEIELEEANATFRLLLNESTRRLKLLSKQLGSSIDKARPYYEALEKAQEAQTECQKGAVKFQRANEIHSAAKETVALAEERFMSNSHEWQFDNAWQEMLNHATQKVMDAEKQKTECHIEHQTLTKKFNKAELKVQQLEDRFRRSIMRSRPYFDEKQICQDQLQTQKNRITELQQQVKSAKKTYVTALKNLEKISDDIHRKRGDFSNVLNNMPPSGPREPGVGAELTSPATVLPDPIAELEKCDYPSFDGSNTSLGSTSQRFTYLLPLPTTETDDINGIIDYTKSMKLLQDNARKKVDEQDLEELRQKVKRLAVRPIEGGDGQQHNDSWEQELTVTVNKLDHLMMLNECASKKHTFKRTNPQRPDLLGAEDVKPMTDKSVGVLDNTHNDVVKLKRAIAIYGVSEASSIPSLPSFSCQLLPASKLKKNLQKLEPLQFVNVSMKELPLLARLSNEIIEPSKSLSMLRRRSLH